VTPWNMPPNSPFCLTTQYGYPSILYTPLSFCLDNNGLGVDRNVGAVSGGSVQYTVKPRFLTLSSVANKWLEIIIGVKWQFNVPGEIYVYTRCTDNGETTFTLRYSDTTLPTNQYASGSSFKTNVNDKMGLYLGRWPVGSIVNNTVYHRGFTRWDNQADAVASMG